MIPNWLLCRDEIGQGAKLAYARLAQYAGEKGACFPRQKTLALELGVSERTANEYIRILVKVRLIEIERRDLRLQNRYYFLDHPWMHEGQPRASAIFALDQQKSSPPDRQIASGPDRQEPSAPIVKENQVEGESKERGHTHSSVADGLPQSLEEAVEVARQLGIEAQFASQEYYSKKSVGWKDGYGNSIVSWREHLQARWAIELRKRAEPGFTRRRSAKHVPAPPRQFDANNYNQPLEDF